MPIPPPVTKVLVVITVTCPTCRDRWDMRFEDPTKLATIKAAVVKSYEDHAIGAHGATR